MAIVLAADASSVDIGAVIFHHYPDHTKKAIAHASKTLKLPEKSYSQIERQAVALSYSAKKFHQYLWGREFALQTDHNPLTTSYYWKKEKHITNHSRSSSKMGIYTDGLFLAH